VFAIELRSLGFQAARHCCPHSIRGLAEAPAELRLLRHQIDLGPKNGKPNDASPSVDRFDPSVGYTIANTSLICWRCNNIKRNYRAEDLPRVAAWMPRRAINSGRVGESELKRPSTLPEAGFIGLSAEATYCRFWSKMC